MGEPGGKEGRLGGAREREREERERMALHEKNYQIYQEFKGRKEREEGEKTLREEVAERARERWTEMDRENEEFVQRNKEAMKAWKDRGEERVTRERERERGGRTH